MPPANRSMDVRDINGMFKMNRYGQRLSVDPNVMGLYAGARRGSESVINEHGSFKTHKNESQAFAHLPTNDYKSSLYRKSD